MIEWEKRVVACHLKPNGFQKHYYMKEESINLVVILEITAREGLLGASTNGNQPILPHSVVVWGCDTLAEKTVRA